MTEAELAERLLAAKRIAVQAGTLLAAKKKELGVIPFAEKGKNDIVTHLDRASEELIVSELHSAFSEDTIFAEEEGLRQYGDQGRWIIDPIDGTENYVRSFPSYAVSIAFEQKYGQPDIGVVYCPPTQELFYARRGCGAWLNNDKIGVSQRCNPQAAISLVSPPFRRHEDADEYYALYKEVFRQTCDVRNTGSAALHACYVAAGRAEAYFEKGVYPFDIAAGLIIAAEAGGTWSSLYSDAHPYTAREILLTNAALHDWYRRQAATVHSLFKQSFP